MKFLKSFFAIVTVLVLTTSCNSKTVTPKVTTFKISGMMCPMGCAKTIENKLSKTAGIQKATVDFDKKLATVNYDASVITTDKIKKTVQETGDGKTYIVSDLK